MELEREAGLPPSHPESSVLDDRSSVGSRSELGSPRGFPVADRVGISLPRSSSVPSMATLGLTEGAGGAGGKGLAAQDELSGVAGSGALITDTTDVKPPA